MDSYNMIIGPLLIRQFHLILRFYEGEKEPSLREPGHGFFLIWSLCGKVFNWPGFFCMWIDWGPFEFSSCFLFTQLVVCEKNKKGLLNHLRFFTSKRWLGKRPCIFTRLQSIGYEDPTMHVQLHVSNQFHLFFFSELWDGNPCHVLHISNGENCIGLLSSFVLMESVSMIRAIVCNWS